MASVPTFDPQRLAAIAQALADTDDGLTGSEIANLLGDCRIPDVSLDMTKWRRLFNAFVDFQNQRQFGNHVVVFITKAMNPVRFAKEPKKFARWKDRLNTVLAFSGIVVGDDGKVRWTTHSATLDEARMRSENLLRLLRGREVHPDVLGFCREELLVKNHFHAVFEATKSVATKLRRLSGRQDDRASLVQAVLGGESPLLTSNALATESDRSEQRGF